MTSRWPLSNLRWLPRDLDVKYRSFQATFKWPPDYLMWILLPDDLCDLKMTFMWSLNDFPMSFMWPEMTSRWLLSDLNMSASWPKFSNNASLRCIGRQKTLRNIPKANIVQNHLGDKVHKHSGGYRSTRWQST